jgi:hypothetical protein
MQLQLMMTLRQATDADFDADPELQGTLAMSYESLADAAAVTAAAAAATTVAAAAACDACEANDAELTAAVVAAATASDNSQANDTELAAVASYGSVKLRANCCSSSRSSQC